MEKITVNGTETLYEIVSIKPVQPNVLQIIFNDAIPVEYGDITIYTDGGVMCSTLTGYNTVYRDEGQTVYLSNDDSVYTAPTEPESDGLPGEPYEPTLEELIAAKKTEINSACEQIIYQGVTVEMSTGYEHFALTQADQLDLFGLQAQLAGGAEQIAYHSDGNPCRFYPASDIAKLIEEAMFHVSYHVTYGNSLKMWIGGAEAKEDLEPIFYGADIPAEYQSEVLQAYLLQIAALAETGGESDEADT